jgi:competence protein ComGC
MSKLQYDFISLVEDLGWVHSYEIDEQEFPSQSIEDLVQAGYLVRKCNVFQSTTL